MDLVDLPIPRTFITKILFFMKKIYLLGLALSMFSMANAQTTVIDDGFESYNLGGVNAGHWANWYLSDPDESLDMAVTDRRAATGNKSGYIGVANDNKGQDAILVMPNVYTSGKVTTEWKMYVPADSVAYYNMQEGATPGDFFGFECTINGYGADADTLTGGISLANKFVWTFTTDIDGQASRVVFGYAPLQTDQWNTVKQVIDLSNGKLNVFVNDAEITYYYYKTDTDPGNTYPDLNGAAQKSVASFDFYSLPDTSNNNGFKSSYYIDDVKVITEEVNGISNVEKNSNLVSLYPNPSKGYINLSIGDAVINNVEIFNVTGQKVLSATPNASSTRLNIEGFASGIYTTRITSKDKVYTKEFVVK
jgi:hypothetical protein